MELGIAIILRGELDADVLPFRLFTSLAVAGGIVSDVRIAPSGTPRRAKILLHIDIPLLVGRVEHILTVVGNAEVGVTGILKDNTGFVEWHEEHYFLRQVVTPLTGTEIEVKILSPRLLLILVGLEVADDGILLATVDDLLDKATNVKHIVLLLVERTGIDSERSAAILCRCHVAVLGCSLLSATVRVGLQSSFVFEVEYEGLG